MGMDRLLEIKGRASMKQNRSNENHHTAVGHHAFHWVIVSLTAALVSAGGPFLSHADFETTDTTQLVLGQDSPSKGYPDAADAHTAANSLWNPKSITACGNWMFVADSSNWRVLGFYKLGSSYKKIPDLVLGKNDFTSNDIAINPLADANKMKSPYGIHCDGTNLFVADSGYNRVLIFKDAAHFPVSPPLNGKRADIVLGQSSFGSSTSGTGMKQMAGPQYVLNAGGKVFVADTQNNRILIFSTSTIFNDPDGKDISAEIVLGGVSAGTSENTFRLPRSVFSDGTRLFVSDTNNHRILYWSTIPTVSHTPANAVLGQSNFTTGTEPPINGYTFRFPETITYANGQLIVADAGHYRVLAYDTSDLSSAAFWNPNLNQPAVHVIGQVSPTTAVNNPVSSRLNWPTGVFSPTGSLGTYFISDYVNHRAVKYESDQFQEVWGQETTQMNSANRGPQADGFNYAAGIAVGAGKTFVVDNINHRVLVFNSLSPATGSAADSVLGQANLTSNDFDPEANPDNTTLNYPTSAAIDSAHLYVCDSSNNRVLYWNLSNPNWPNRRPADGVIGQPEMNTRSIASETLAGPNSVYSDGRRVFVADSNHHRVLVWKKSDPEFGKVTSALILGQPTSTSVGSGKGANQMSVPFALYSDGLRLFVADKNNNRILVWNDVENLSDPINPLRGKPADFVLGQTGFGLSDPCTDPNDNPTTASKPCVSTPLGITGDGDRLFVGHYSYIPSDTIDTDVGRVLEWRLPITENNQKPIKKLWVGRSPTPITLTRWGLRQIQMFDKDLWVADLASNRVVKFTDTRSTYVDITVSGRTPVDSAPQDSVIKGLDIVTGDSTHAGSSRSVKWASLSARQEGGMAGDIKEVLLCDADATDCGESPLATLDPTETPGLFSGIYTGDVAPGKRYALAFRLSPTAHVGQSVGISLQMNSAFFKFKDKTDDTAAYVKSINAPARVSPLTTVLDKPDTLGLIVGSTKDISVPIIAQNTNVPFLEFQLKTNNDQVVWQSLFLHKLGTAGDADVSAAVWADGATTGWSGDETMIGSVNQFTGGKGTVNVSQTILSMAQRFFITLNAKPTSAGTVGVKVSSSPTAFSVGSPDQVETPYASFSSAESTIVAHGPNILLGDFVNRVADGQTVDQGARVVMAKAAFWTDKDWSDLTEWKINQIGSAGAGDMAAVELWKDVNNNGDIDSGTDILVNEGSPILSTAEKDFRFDLRGTRITTTPTRFLVAMRTAPNAHPGVTLGAFLSNSNVKGDPNTTPQSLTLNTKLVTIAASRDIVTVQSFAESISLSQGDEKSLVRKLLLSTDKNAALWQSLTVHQQGTADAIEDVKSVSLLKETAGVKETISTGVLNALNKTWTLTFSDQLLTPTPSAYYLAVDIGHLAVAGRTVVMNIISTASVGLEGTADIVSPSGFAHVSDTAAIQQALSVMTVTGHDVSLVSLEKEVGATDIDLATFAVSVDKASVQWQKLSLLLTGAGAEPADVAKLDLYTSHVFFASATVRPGTNYFDFVMPVGFRINFNDAKTYTLRANISPSASPGDELTFSLANGGLVVQSPAEATVTNPGHRFQTLPLKVKEPATTLSVTNWAPLAPGTVFQTAQRVEMATFTVKMSGYTGEWVKLNVNRAEGATFFGSDLSAVLLYRDDNTSGHWENTDTLLASGNFSANVNKPAELTLSSTETLTSVAKGYILVVNVAGNAKEGNTIGLKLGSASNFVLLSPDSAVFPPASNFTTGLAEIKATTDALFIENTQDDVAPSPLLQGSESVSFLSLAMAARSNEVTLRGFDLFKSGTLDDRFIEDVRLMEDTNLDGTPDKVWSVGTHRFNSNRVTLAFDGQDNVLIPKGENTGQITRRYFVALTISPLAPPDTTLRLSLERAIVEAPDTVENAGALGIANDDDRTIADRPDTVSPHLQDIPQLILAGTVDQGAANAAVLLLHMPPNEDHALWSKLSADLNIVPAAGRLDPLVPDDFTRFALFRDDNNNAVLDTLETANPLSVGTIVGQSITFLLPKEALIPDGPGYFLAVSLKEDAPAGEAFKISLRNPGSQAIEPVDLLQWPAAPMDSVTLTVRNVTAPTKPVIADYEDPAFATQDFLHATYTPPDLVGRGQFASSAIQIPFSWGSQMADGRGGIKSAEYCLGTVPGNCDAHPWTSFTPKPGVFLAKGLNLSHGVTYFIAVRATSEQYNKRSDVGVSNGILIDLDRPQRPVVNEPFVEPSGYSLLWQTVLPTLSGLSGYILEERSESSPAWKPIPPPRSGLLRPELTTDGTSLTLVDNKPGSYFYRVVAVNGVGTRSEASAAVRVDFALTQLPSFLSQASNYPNPFDAKNGPTKITYTLKADSDVKLRFYDGFGRQVREDLFSAGSPGATAGGNTIEWDGKDGEHGDLPQGSYVIRLNAGGEDVRWKIGVWR